ncbi:MAG: uncharacterized protein JWM85_712 [Acidimicrobiaceae bacterium]|nr:uncharacterized protein [Acidimicrobiaceae bacterium]
MRRVRLPEEKHPRVGRFAHPSEAKLAELLDFYGVRYEYEPVEFTLAWDERGRPCSAFRPDFYLPDENLFLELTTLRQDLVTRKNRKLRRLAELYPEVRVRMLYRRDYANLLLKADLAGLARRANQTALAHRPEQRTA